MSIAACNNAACNNDLSVLFYCYHSVNQLLIYVSELLYATPLLFDVNR